MIKVLVKAINILILLSDNPIGPISLGTISDKTGINKSTCARILQTLCCVHMTTQISRKDGYVLGPLAYYLIRYGRYQQEFIQICHPVLKWLHNKINETVLITVIGDDMRKYIIHYIEGNVKLVDPTSNYIENVINQDAKNKLSKKHSKMIMDDIYSTAAGRIIMAYMEKDEIKRIFELYGPPTDIQWPGVNTINKMLNELKFIRDQGYSFVQRIDSPERMGYACAIKDKSGSIAAIGISLESRNYCEKENNNFTVNLMAAAKEINRRVKYNG